MPGIRPAFNPCTTGVSGAVDYVPIGGWQIVWRISVLYTNRFIISIMRLSLKMRLNLKLLKINSLGPFTNNKHY